MSSPFNPASVPGGGGGSYAFISENVLGSAATTITLSGLGTTYRHLILLFYARGDTAATNVQVNCQVNGDAGANYNGERGAAFGVGISAAGQGAANSFIAGFVPANTATASQWGVIELILPFFSTTAAFKNVIGRRMSSLDNTAANQGADLIGGTWNNTAAITQVTFLAAAGNFITGSRLASYGLT